MDITDLFGICLRCRDHSFLWISEHIAPNKVLYEVKVKVKQGKIRGILDVKMIFMEQKEHLLCNWESCE